jgi:hypothetical protein
VYDLPVSDGLDLAVFEITVEDSGMRLLGGGKERFRIGSFEVGPWVT